MDAPLNRSTWDKARDILSILVIPLILWGVRLEVRLAVQEQHIAENKKAAAQVERLSGSVHANALQMARLDAKVDAIHERLREIKVLISGSSSGR